MTDVSEAAVEAHNRDLVEPAATLNAVQKTYGDKVRAQCDHVYGRVHELGIGESAGCQSRCVLPDTKSDYCSSERVNYGERPSSEREARN